LADTDVTLLVNAGSMKQTGQVRFFGSRVGGNRQEDRAWSLFPVALMRLATFADPKTRNGRCMSRQLPSHRTRLLS
jgi:hypothetical protein